MSNVVITGRWPRQAATSAHAVPRRLDGERLAVGATAAGVAVLPLLTPSGPANVAPADVFISLAVLAVLFWAGNSSHRLRLPFALPIGLILVAGALGSLAGPVPRLGVVALAQDLALVAWFWALTNVGSSPDRLQTILRTWALASIGWAVVLLVALAAGMESITGQTERHGSRTALTFDDPNISGSYYFISIMVLWAAGYPRHRGLRLAAYALLLAALFTTGSITAFLSVIAGVAVAVVLGFYRRGGLLPAITALAFIALAGFFLASNVTPKDIQETARGSSYAFVRDGLGRSESTTADRGVLLRQNVELYETGGVLGSGPLSTKVRLREETAQRVKEAHNDYFAAVNERGVLGLLGTLLLVFGLGLHALRLGSTPSGGQLVRHAIVRPNALAGAVAGTLVAMTAHELLHIRHVWALFALIVAAALQVRR